MIISKPLPIVFRILWRHRKSLSILERGKGFFISVLKKHDLSCPKNCFYEAAISENSKQNEITKVDFMTSTQGTIVGKEAKGVLR